MGRCRRRPNPDNLVAEDFPLAAIAPTLQRWRETLLHGRGFLSCAACR